jgi:hypothetical protein
VSRQTLVAMRYSHARNSESPSNLSRLRHARRKSPGRRPPPRRRTRACGSSGRGARAGAAAQASRRPTRPVGGDPPSCW